jgi:hypothetical protein
LIKDLAEVPNGWKPACAQIMTRNCNPRTSSLTVIASTITALALMVAVLPAEAPPCRNCPAQQGLPSAGVVPDAPAASPVQPPNDPAVQAQPRGCAEWTDRCVICQRDAGKITCSNIGIACQPQAVECVRAEPAEEKRGN